MSESKYFVIGVFLIIGAFVLILYSGDYLDIEVKPQVFTFKEYTFTKIGLFWYFDWFEGNTTYRVPLRFNPAEVRDVVIKGRLNDSFNNASEAYITFDPETDPDNFKYLALAASELSLSMNGAIGMKPIAACTKNETSACVNRPVVTCNDKNLSVVYLKIPNDPKSSGVFFLDNCIVLIGQEMDLLKAVDRLLYNWYGILI